MPASLIQLHSTILKHNFEMANLKLELDEADDDFALLAIHCSEEEFKLAYLLNLHLRTRFTRRKTDLDFTKGEWVASFPIYDFEDGQNYNFFHLVSNKSRIMGTTSGNSVGLFESSALEKSKIQYLFPEFRKVDYFLKIYSDFESISLRNLIHQISQIKEVISAYEVKLCDMKNKDNLIFD